MSWPHNGETGIMLMRATRAARCRHWQQQRIERLACLQCTSAGRTAEINSLNVPRPRCRPYDTIRDAILTSG